MIRRTTNLDIRIAKPKPAEPEPVKLAIEPRQTCRGAEKRKDRREDVEGMRASLLGEVRGMMVIGERIDPDSGRDVLVNRIFMAINPSACAGEEGLVEEGLRYTKHQIREGFDRGFSAEMLTAMQDAGVGGSVVPQDTWERIARYSQQLARAMELQNAQAQR